jgi:hypothetical protein
LIPAGEMLHLLVTIVLGDDAIEFAPIEECCKLGEYVLILMHMQND